MLWVTSADLSVSLCVYFYLWAPEREIKYQWRTCSPALWIKMTLAFFRIFPSGQKEDHSCWNAYFVRAEGHESLWQAYIKLFSFHCLSFFIWGDVATGTERLVCKQPFLSNDFRSSCGDVCRPVITKTHRLVFTVAIRVQRQQIIKPDRCVGEMKRHRKSFESTSLWWQRGIYYFIFLKYLFNILLFLVNYCLLFLNI